MKGFSDYNKIFLIHRFIIILFFCILIFGKFKIIQAADLYFSPLNPTYPFGQNFSISLFVSSPEQAINAVSASITFSNNLLEVVSLSTQGSIITNWIQGPSFSNISGTIDLEGIVLNPGYQGSSGKILTIIFRPKITGVAFLNFLNSSILANDGMGTNILVSANSAQINIISNVNNPPPTTISTTPPATLSQKLTPKAIKITSPSHPDQEIWYQKNSIRLEWSLDSDIIDLSYLLDQNPNTIPKTSLNKVINFIEFHNLKSGIWYFHLRAKNQYGWGEVSHFKIQIDNIPPEFSKFEIDNLEDPTNPQPYLILKAEDSFSGINSYEIKIENYQNFIIKASDVLDGRYQLPIISPGEYLVKAIAVDNAGNKSEYKEPQKLIVQPLTPPILVEYPRTLLEGVPLIIKGFSPIEIEEVKIFIENLKNGVLIAGKAIIENKRNFIFIYNKTLLSGIYSAWAEAEDLRGAKSLPSEKIHFIIKQSFSVFLKENLKNPFVVGCLFIITIESIIILKNYLKNKKRIIRR